MEQIGQILNQEYALSVNHIQSVGPVWKVYSGKGIFLLKQMQRDAHHLQWLQEVFFFFKNNNFVGLTPFLTTKNGLPFINHNGNNYIIAPWIDGANPSFQNSNHIRQIGALWAQFHQVSKQISIKQDERRDFLKTIGEKTKFLTEVPKTLALVPHPNQIERKLCDWYSHFLHQAEFCFHGLQQLKFSHSDTFPLGFCHNDPAPRNIIMRNQELHLIDFELSGVNLFILEFAMLLQRVLTANRWNRQPAEWLISSYSSVRPFTSDETKALPYICFFPQRFWRFCNQRFQEQLKWSEGRYRRRLWNILNEEKLRLTFLHTFWSELNL